MRWLLSLAVTASAHAAPPGPATRPVRAPRPVLSDLQYEEITNFVELVLAGEPPGDRRARVERGLRDLLVRLAELEPALLPKHPLTPFASSLERAVDKLAAELASVLNLRASADDVDAGRAAISRALTIVARLHLATGANAGPQDEWMMRYYALATLILIGSTGLILVGISWPSEFFMMKGMDGAMITVAMGLGYPLVHGVRWLAGHLPPKDPTARRRVAHEARRRFWTRVVPSTAGDVRAVDAGARELVRALLARDHGALAACERLMGSSGR